MYWEALAAANRFLLYLCTLMTLGLVFCNWLSTKHLLSLPLSLPGQALLFGLGAFSVISSYVLFVGNMAMAGFWGMFDRDLLQFLWPDAAGRALRFQLPAFILLLLSLLCNRLKPLAGLMQGIALLLLLLGFLQGGHLRQFGLIGQVLLWLHLVCVGLWVGSLPLLWRLCRQSQTTRLHALLHHFGRIMIGVVLLLLLSGAGMLWLLFSEPSQLWSTTYGRLILLKLVLVAALLSMGALNKLKLVPALKHQPNPRQLQAVIGAEMLFASAIVAISSVVTVLIGWSG